MVGNEKSRRQRGLRGVRNPPSDPIPILLPIRRAPSSPSRQELLRQALLVRIRSRRHATHGQDNVRRHQGQVQCDGHVAGSGGTSEDERRRLRRRSRRSEAKVGETARHSGLWQRRRLECSKAGRREGRRRRRGGRSGASLLRLRGVHRGRRHGRSDSLSGGRASDASSGHARVRFRTAIIRRSGLRVGRCRHGFRGTADGEEEEGSRRTSTQQGKPSSEYGRQGLGIRSLPRRRRRKGRIRHGRRIPDREHGGPTPPSPEEGIRLQIRPKRPDGLRRRRIHRHRTEVRDQGRSRHGRAGGNPPLLRRATEAEVVGGTRRRDGPRSAPGRGGLGSRGQDRVGGESAGSGGDGGVGGYTEVETVFGEEGEEGGGCQGGGCQFEIGCILLRKSTGRITRRKRDGKTRTRTGIHYTGRRGCIAEFAFGTR
mmetsp:Transcript_3355/g.6229  ORF Transcript_3355/g.6229 Transcript_3355/m.6229 type:complete len:427 (+) Transcript_3355:504-1784(+)